MVKSVNKAYWLNVEEVTTAKKYSGNRFSYMDSTLCSLDLKKLSNFETYLFFLSLKIWIVLNIAIRTQFGS